MKRRIEFLITLLISLLLTMPCIGMAQENPEKSAPQIITIEPSKNSSMKPLKDLLPDKLAGGKATSETKEYQADNLHELTGDETRIYQEYRLVSAASRLYLGSIQADIFQMDTPDAAFGLFTFQAGNNFTFQAGNNLTSHQKHQVGVASVWNREKFIFWKDRYLVRVRNANEVDKAAGIQESIAAEIANNISSPDKPIELPTLLHSLPKNYVERSERYFLGAESLNAYFERGRDIFSFNGDAEATIAEYQKPDAVANRAEGEPGKGATKHRPASRLTVSKPFKLVIVEYHTPQFATEAEGQATAYLASLSEAEQSRLIVKRIGNFLVGASNFEDREYAEQLVSSIEYPYVVKWLQNPAIPTRDPFQEQKVAQVILSSFSLVGLAGLIMMTGGLLVGTFVFLRRRRQNRESFSDAGGMLRLQLDPMENIILGLPPQRSNDEG